MSVAGLAMEASLGHILGSGPSNAAVDNLAHRLDQISRSACARYNSRNKNGGPCMRHKLVVRGYNKQRELAAFMSLLEDPDFVPANPGTQKNPWQLDLSVAYWLLVLLRSRARGVHVLDPDDSEELHCLQIQIDQRDDLKHLRAVAVGRMSWHRLRQKEDLDSLLRNQISALMNTIVNTADILCVTPAKAVSKRDGYAEWARKKARGVLIDAAANMHRGDIGCVWGNCLLPCILGGDARQLAPLVVTGDEKDSAGNLYNRHVQDGKLSALTFLQTSGLPVYRLRTQLRMANGLFDWLSEQLYRERFAYGPACAIDLPEFKAGRLLEGFFQARFPTLRAPPRGKFLPIFVHCEGAAVYFDQRTGSRKAPKQVSTALDIAVDLVTTGINPSRITILSPYAANVDLIGRSRREAKYRPLISMGPACTVDSFQGQENDIIIVVMGTAFPKPGPGFTSDPHRLNVLLTRQRCGLVVVGNINIYGQPDDAARGQKRTWHTFSRLPSPW